MVTPTFKIEGIDKALKLFDPNVVRKAVRSTVNKLHRQAKTVSSKEVRKVYNISAAELRKKLKFKTATLSDLTSVIFIHGRPISLSKFKAKQLKNKMVVTFKVKKQGGRQRINAFMATMPNGHVGVFWRKGSKRLTTKGRYAGTKTKRQPIFEGKTVSIPQMYDNPKVFKAIEDLIKSKSGKILDNELEFFLGKV